MHFVSEGVTPSTTALPDIVNLSTSYLDMTTREDRIHSIKDFLSRPIIIATNLWSASDPVEKQLYTANFPEVLISNAMYQDKLKGFVGLRATLVVKVQVNSQPFQQGRLMLQYIPYAQYMPNRVTLINETLQGRSGCPRTDLELSVGTEVEMRIPYVSPHLYYNLITGQGSFGSIYVVVYSQLHDQVSGTGSIEYTVWAHLEDVDVQYPTGANIFTGNSPNYLSIAERIATGDFTEAEMRKLWTDKTYSKKPARIYAQAARELKQLETNNSPSTALGQISEGLSTLTHIPVLGNIFSTPAWISAKAADLAKLFGFSKPTVQGKVGECKLRGQGRMANFDGMDLSHKMALSSANEIETKEGLAGTSLDEMDLSRVLSIPNYWDRFTWKTSDLTNAILWDNFVSPFKVKPYSAEVTDRFRCTHMGYVANAFTYWRGSIVYTFKFVKTQYHSGRLRISFIPYYYNETISTGVPDVSRTQKIVVDLRTSTEVSFTVPYIASRPWLYCIRPESAWLTKDEKPGALMYNCVSGIVRVEVLNQLVAAQNVFSEIDVICEVNGGPDLEFAGPTCPSYVPYAGTFTVAATNKIEEEKMQEYSNNKNKRITTQCGKIFAQVMGEDQQIPRNEAQHGVHPVSIDTHRISNNWSPQAMCIGEKVVSIRQLIKRFGIFGDATTLQAEGASFVVAPFTVTSPTKNLNSSRNYTQFDYYYYLYAFWRGSMRVKMVAETLDGEGTARKKTDFTWFVRMFNSLQDSFNSLISTSTSAVTTKVLPGGTINMGPSTQVVDPTVEGLIEVEAPYYNISHITPAVTIDDGTPSMEDYLKGHSPPCLLTFSPRDNITATHQVTASFMRAPGDDFSFMYLLGVPPLVNVSRA